MRLLGPVARRLRAGGADVSVIVGDRAADALERACAAVAERPDALVAFGGDGLVHLAVQAVAGHGRAARHHPRRDRQRHRHRSRACRARTRSRRRRTVLRGRSRLVDAARIRAGHGPTKLFAGVVCCGFDSRVNERANGLTWPPGMAKYLLATFQELRRSSPSRSASRSTAASRDRAGGHAGRGGQHLLLRRGDAGLSRTPQPDDGLLDVMVLGALSKAEFLRVFPSVYRGTHVTTRPCRWAGAGAAGGARRGGLRRRRADRAGPVTCEVRPGALRVIARDLQRKGAGRTRRRTEGSDLDALRGGRRVGGPRGAGLRNMASTRAAAITPAADRNTTWTPDTSAPTACSRTSGRSAPAGSRQAVLRRRRLRAARMARSGHPRVGADVVGLLLLRSSGGHAFEGAGQPGRGDFRRGVRPQVRVVTLAVELGRFGRRRGGRPGGADHRDHRHCRGPARRHPARDRQN